VQIETLLHESCRPLQIYGTFRRRIGRSWTGHWLSNAAVWDEIQAEKQSNTSYPVLAVSAHFFLYLLITFSIVVISSMQERFRSDPLASSKEACLSAGAGSCILGVRAAVVALASGCGFRFGLALAFANACLVKGCSGISLSRPTSLLDGSAWLIGSTW